tara:strand:- start:502 stop:1578 length:1077 start_codon:yes stop_codon:yes gene_type:complete
MDVLIYSALNEQAALKKDIAEKQKCLFDLKLNAKDPAAAGGASGDPVECAKAWLGSTGNEKAHWFCPDDTSLWTIYTGGGWTGEVEVCDTSGYYRCGASCTWTVPSGVTKARFQIWGAGGGANKPPCCCGHTVFGSTGAYASVIIPVESGWTYTLCAGCAYCCYGYTTENHRRWSGHCSYVQGCKLCNFCASGGQGSMGTWMSMIGTPCTCRYQYYTNGNGMRFCNNGADWCWDGENSQGEVMYIAGAGYHGNIKDIENPTAENVVYGLRGIWPRNCWDGNHYGYEIHAPVWDGTQAYESKCCVQYTSGNCCGCQCSAWAMNCLRMPGAGGWGSHAMGGGNGLYGDSGKFGKVHVCYS